MHVDYCKLKITIKALQYFRFSRKRIWSTYTAFLVKMKPFFPHCIFCLGELLCVGYFQNENQARKQTNQNYRKTVFLDAMSG